MYHLRKAYANYSINFMTLQRLSRKLGQGSFGEWHIYRVFL